MYKLKYPLEELKKINSLLSEYFGDYFIKDGVVLGQSLNNWAVNIGAIPRNISDSLQLDNILIPPNQFRKVLADAKKTKTAIEISDKGFRLYQFEDKITGDEPDLSKGELVIDICRHNNDNSDIWKYMMETDIRVKNIMQSGVSIDELSFDDIPSNQYNEAFAADDVFSVNNELGGVIVSRQLFPKYQKILSLSWSSFDCDEEYAYAVFKAEYADLTMLTIVKFIKGII